MMKVKSENRKHKNK